MLMTSGFDLQVELGVSSGGSFLIDHNVRDDLTAQNFYPFGTIVSLRLCLM